MLDTIDELVDDERRQRKMNSGLLQVITGDFIEAMNGLLGALRTSPRREYLFPMMFPLIDHLIHTEVGRNGTRKEVDAVFDEMARRYKKK